MLGIGFSGLTFSIAFMLYISQTPLFLAGQIITYVLGGLLLMIYFVFMIVMLHGIRTDDRFKRIDIMLKLDGED